MTAVNLRFLSAEGKDKFGGRSFPDEVPEVPGLGTCLRLPQPQLGAEGIALTGREEDFTVTDVRRTRQLNLFESAQQQRSVYRWQTDIFLTANEQAPPREVPPAVSEAVAEVQAEVELLRRSAQVELELAKGPAKARRTSTANYLTRKRLALETLLALAERNA